MKLSEDARNTALLLATTILAAKQLTARYQENLEHPRAFRMIGAAREPVRQAFRLAEMILKEIEERPDSGDIFTHPRWDRVEVNGEEVKLRAKS